MNKIKTAFILFPIKDRDHRQVVGLTRPLKIFQISHLKKINNQTIETIYINKEKPIYKILKLPELITIYRCLQFKKC